MTGRDLVAGLRLDVHERPHDRTRLSLVDESAGDVEACRLTIDPLRMHDGAGGVVHLDGIGNVATPEAYRRRGLASRLLEVAIERMREGGADGSLLYGIEGFYEPFGWRSCGDERWVRVPLDGARDGGDVRRPAGYEVRPATARDLPALHAAYDAIAVRVPGALVRGVGGRAWASLDPAEVHVVLRGGELVGWAWRGRGSVAERDAVAGREPGAAVFAELQAVDEDAMRVVLDVALAVARADEGEPGRRDLLVGAPEGHSLRRLARAGAVACTLVDEVRPSGGPMLLPFTAAGEALGAGLYQFLPDRF